MNLQADLSKRQEQVAGFMATGYAKKQIAGHLNISERTVENTARNIYEKIGVNSVGQLSAWWFCKKFNIPIELLPRIKMQGLAFCLVSLLTINEIFGDSDYVRKTSSKTAKVSKTRKGKRKCDDDDTLTIETV
jgi:DNA-binding CsgD family transcriptional regulator